MLQNLLPKDLWLLIGSYLNYLRDLPTFQQVIPDLNFKPIDRKIVEEYYDRNTKALWRRITYLDHIKIKNESWYSDGKKRGLEFYDKNSRILKYTSWYANGQIKTKIITYGPDYIWTNVYSSRGILTNEYILNSSNTGIMYGWDQTGKILQSRTEYRNSLKSKTATVYYAATNGNQYIEVIESKNDLKNGKNFTYTNRELTKIEEYKDDVSMSIWKYDPVNDFESIGNRFNKVTTICRSEKCLILGDYKCVNGDFETQTGVEVMYEFDQKVPFYSDLSRLIPGKKLIGTNYVNKTRHGLEINYMSNSFGVYVDDKKDGVWRYLDIKKLEVWNNGELINVYEGENYDRYMEDKPDKELQELLDIRRENQTQDRACEEEKEEKEDREEKKED